MKEFIEQLEKDFNKFVDETKEKMEELAERMKGKNKAPEAGDVVKISGIEWLILDKTEDVYYAITKDFIDLGMKFDPNKNDWRSSELREFLNGEFLAGLEEDMLLEFERDLTSLDGQTEYGACTDKVSLLTVDEYRKYRKYLPNTKKWWWLITPWSTPCNDWERAVTVVSPSGYFIRDYCFYNFGVRPFCILKSNIFVSKESK